MPTNGRVMEGTLLAGRRVLVVEDEALVAMLVEDALLDAGAEVLGPVRSVPEALALMAKQVPDAAVLDVNLDGVPSTPIADALAAAGVPFIVATGYGIDGLPPGHAGVLVLAKPYDPVALTQALAGFWPAPK
ncbi:response regulator receiver domain-containing protein [Humitalea rosea]|uniref:Response regulator receiver domain-containing protein n=1 Tax=Humitalea rosea TaxID=990373 RepID=A0A2W7IIF0_9PROT|nr:response regulator [Humitalea rosea]PZW44915.1 response regulator receiver domain-containing protein [Humitalea rosea]